MLVSYWNITKLQIKEKINYRSSSSNSFVIINTPLYFYVHMFIRLFHVKNLFQLVQSKRSFIAIWKGNWGTFICTPVLCLCNKWGRYAWISTATEIFVSMPLICYIIAYPYISSKSNNISALCLILTLEK